MENCIGKICPYCKTEIKEGDAVTICPACGIPHHEGCWTENKGCTTFGCSEQHYEPQGTNPTEVCANCGAPLGDGQAFCSKCGTAKAAAPAKTFCSKCGAELQDGQEFCPKCGQKAGLVMDANVNSAINQFNAAVNQANEAKKAKPMKLAIIGVIAVAVIAILSMLLPKIFVSVEGLCEQGQYMKAYEKAEGSEKDQVLAENVIAVLSEEASDRLKDPSSFVLREGYYYCFVREDGTFGQQAVLYLSGNNSYGAAVSNYWVFVYSNEKSEWEYWGSADTTKTESDDELEDLLVKVVLSTVLEDGIQLEKSQVKNINNMFKADTLFEVGLIPKSSIDTSRFPLDG